MGADRAEHCAADDGSIASPARDRKCQSAGSGLSLGKAGIALRSGLQSASCSGSAGFSGRVRPARHRRSIRRFSMISPRFAIHADHGGRPSPARVAVDGSVRPHAGGRDVVVIRRWAMLYIDILRRPLPSESGFSGHDAPNTWSRPSMGMSVPHASHGHRRFAAPSVAIVAASDNATTSSSQMSGPAENRRPVQPDRRAAFRGSDDTGLETTGRKAA